MATKVMQPQVVEKYCIVCGQGSHRLDWQSKDNPTCDTHTSTEIQAALAKLKPSPVPAASKPATPNSGTVKT